MWVTCVVVRGHPICCCQGGCPSQGPCHGQGQRRTCWKHGPNGDLCGVTRVACVTCVKRELGSAYCTTVYMVRQVTRLRICETGVTASRRQCVCECARARVCVCMRTCACVCLLMLWWWWWWWWWCVCVCVCVRRGLPPSMAIAMAVLTVLTFSLASASAVLPRGLRSALMCVVSCRGNLACLLRQLPAAQNVRCQATHAPRCKSGMHA